MPGTCALSSKDLSIIEDQLAHLATGCRVAAAYQNQFTHPELKGVASAIAQHSRQQYDALFAFLNGCQ